MKGTIITCCQDRSCGKSDDMRRSRRAKNGTRPCLFSDSTALTVSTWGIPFASCTRFR